MHLEIIAYPFIFAAIYFEAFLLVTFLSKPARVSRARALSTRTPSVAMIVPCYNEESTVAGTADSLLALEYPKKLLRIILVNDGSTDGTAQVMARYENHPQVTVITQKNSGKHAAINAGIEAAPDAELIGCLDADSFVESNALREMIACFDDENVGAATAAMSVHKPKTMLERMQNAEYIMGIALRHILASVNGLYVTPGPFSLYRNSIVKKLGGFRFGHQAEDMEMALRIQRAGHIIESAHSSRVYTTAPTSVRKLVKQRTRWTTGFLRNMTSDYKDLVGNRRYGALGLMVLPLGFAAIVGGITLFAIALYKVLSEAFNTYFIAHGIPFSYLLTPRLEWFYFPLTVVVLLALVAAVGSIAFMVVGKRISNTPSNITAGIIAYALLYGFIAPFWLMRAVADVAIGTKRSWR